MFSLWHSNNSKKCFTFFIVTYRWNLSSTLAQEIIFLSSPNFKTYKICFFIYLHIYLDLIQCCTRRICWEDGSNEDTRVSTERGMFSEFNTQYTLIRGDVGYGFQSHHWCKWLLIDLLVIFIDHVPRVIIKCGI